MRKYFFLLIISLIFSNSSAYSKSTKFYWSKITYTKQTSYYLDQRSIKKVGPYLYFWLLSNYDVPDKEGTKSVVSINRVECNTMQSQMLSYTSYFDFFAEGRLKSDFIVPNPKWSSFGSKSAQYIILKNVCRN
jgi:hypothetical protein